MLIDTHKLVASGAPAEALQLSTGDYGWVSGYGFRGDEPQLGRDLAEAVRAALADEDVKRGLNAVNGSFWAVLVTAARDRLDLVSDRVGTRPLYYAEVEGGLRISEDFWALCASLPAPKLCVAAAVDLLTFDYALGEHTLVEQIREVPPATRLTFRLDPRGGVATRAGSLRYWRHDLQPERRSRPALVAELGDIFERMAVRTGALVRRMGVQKVGLNLSAGRDSRVLACLLHSAGVPTHCFTSAWARGENEAAFAVTQALGWPHTFLPFWASAGPVPCGAVFWALAPTTKFSLANHVVGLGTFGTEGVGALVSGHMGDTMATAYIKWPTYAWQRRGRAFLTDVVVRHHTRWQPAGLRQILRAEHAGAADSGVRHLYEICQRAEVSHPLGLGPQVDIEHAERRFILRDYLGQRQISDSILPLGDYEFIDFFLRVPIEWLLGGALYVTTLRERLLTGGCAALARIPMNGQRAQTVRFPLLWNVGQFARFCSVYTQVKLGQRIRRGRQMTGCRPLPAAGEYVDDGTQCGWVTGLDWLCDVDAVRRLIANGLSDEVFVASKLRSLYTLARASARIRGQEHA